jgi:hypothetical protein
LFFKGTKAYISLRTHPIRPFSTCSIPSSPDKHRF